MDRMTVVMAVAVVRDWQGAPCTASRPSGDLPVRDFVVSPGFAGVLALLAAVIVSCAVLYWARRARQRFEQRREQQERRQEQTRDDAANALAWERW
jgi:hypothetical protein